MRYTLTVLMTLVLNGCNPKLAVKDIHMGQGMLAGEVTTNSVILQARLTKTEEFQVGKLSGTMGFGRFQVATDSTFVNPLNSGLLQTFPERDFILKTRFDGLKNGTEYFYRLQYGKDKNTLFTSKTGSFKTLQGEYGKGEVSLAFVSCMNYYFFYYGKYDISTAYQGEDKEQGYKALKAISKLKPDYFFGVGDNVYFDHPNKKQYEAALSKGKNPHPGVFEGKEVVDEEGMRRKYHQQFSQPRLKSLLSTVGSYWLKDDHDYRLNDADTIVNFPITHTMGIKNFKEQLPVLGFDNYEGKTYRTYRINKDLQIWMLEGRNYRSPNEKANNSDKTLLGQNQLDWLKETLLESEANFKLIISPTPMIGPDDKYKKDNHTNLEGFSHERDKIFEWLTTKNLQSNTLIVCGDRHWQYHSMSPEGIEEFSIGALEDRNSRAGRLAGDPDSTDPKALVTQYYVQADNKSATGGFLMVNIEKEHHKPKLSFKFYNDDGEMIYEEIKKLNQKIDKKP